MSPVKSEDFGFSNLSSDNVNIELNLPGVTATGGDATLTPGNGYKYHIFTSPGTFTVSKEGHVDTCIVAGGGGGGKSNLGPYSRIYCAGGGGGGGIVQRYGVKFPANAYTVSIGSGGAGGGSPPTNGSPGSNSYIDGTGSTPTYTATGGGGGGKHPGGDGGAGGSGGGGAMPSGDGGNGTTGQGNDGINGGYQPPNIYRGGNGGGAGLSHGSLLATGGVGLAAFNGDTGIPPSYGTSGPGPGRYFAGGGGGLYGVYSTYYTRAGGDGGGGLGTYGNGGDGTTNTGGGGGSSTGPTSTGGDGGSGIVIIRYRNPE